MNVKVEDYFQIGKRSLIRFKGKGGKEKDIPVHHKLEEILDEYLKVSMLREQPDAPLFPTTLGKSRELGFRPMTGIDGANLLKRRLKDAGIVGDYSPILSGRPASRFTCRTTDGSSTPSRWPDTSLPEQRSCTTGQRTKLH
jgi:hypothetical protein